MHWNVSTRHDSTVAIGLAAGGTLLDWGHMIKLSGIADYSGGEVLHCLKLEEVSSCCV